MPKYKEKNIAILSNDLYFEILESKGVKSLTIKKTVHFDHLRGRQFGILSEHLWSYGDNLFKLSFRFYGDPKFWWIIALLNNKPTDAHYSIGDKIYIPSNPIEITELMK